MTYAGFKASPWSTSHLAYKESPLSLSPAPEYANSEVLVSGLYRTIGLDVSEGAVPVRGRELDRKITQARDRRETPEGAALDGDAVNALLRIIVESPKLPNQSSKRFIQVMPLVGETASFSGSARLAGNPWPAGQLISRMVSLGSMNQEAAKKRWSELFGALGVDVRDDVFARFLRDELEAWTDKKWGPLVPSDEDVGFLPVGELDGLAFPARQFALDLGAIIAAKTLMTRRQWISLLDALVRMAAVAHVAWLCEVQARIWDCIQVSMKGGDNAMDLRLQIYPRELCYLRFGTSAVSELKDRTSRYLLARLGINAVLWRLAEMGAAANMSSAADIAKLCNDVKGRRAELAGVLEDVQELSDREMRTLLCRKGIGSNLMEFARHVLYQRQAADQRLRGYDQGYVLRKRGPTKSSQWMCSPGPVAVLAIVHCSLAGLSGPRSVHRFAQHLAAYGISINHRDIAQNELGHQLRMLGLVLDSPDAESGMLLVPPFTKSDAA
jgi:hypothetical protein